MTSCIWRGLTISDIYRSSQISILFVCMVSPCSIILMHSLEGLQVDIILSNPPLKSEMSDSQSTALQALYHQECMIYPCLFSLKIADLCFKNNVENCLSELNIFQDKIFNILDQRKVSKVPLWIVNGPLAMKDHLKMLVHCAVPLKYYIFTFFR